MRTNGGTVENQGCGGANDPLWMGIARLGLAASALLLTAWAAVGADEKPVESAVTGSTHVVYLQNKDATSSILMRSPSFGGLWQGEIQLEGQKWYLAAVFTVSSPFPSLRPKGKTMERTPSYLVLRPWESRGSAVNWYSDSCQEAGVFPATERLYLLGRAYRFSSAFEGEGKANRLKVVLSELPGPTGELRFTGSSIRQVILRGDYTARLVSPGSAVRVPVGNYSGATVWLQSGSALAQAYANYDTPLVITTNAPTTLTAGGPLTNCVSVYREGRVLTLSYQLIGVGGALFTRLGIDRGVPPQFAVYHGERRIAFGNFEFG
jgi:hypothetical protein